MKGMKKCDTKGCFSHRSQILGAVFLVIATILTLLTLNGFGILGMFLVGILLCRHHMMGCQCCGCCPCCCNSEADECMPCDDAETAAKKKLVKKSTVKK